LHQASFRDAVLSAYGGRCAISHLPEPRLLDAAHIIMGAEEKLGQPVVVIGLPLTEIHPSAVDAHLSASAQINRFTSPIACQIRDGAFLELGLRAIAEQGIQVPQRGEDRRDRDQLAVWFEQFKKSA
jgi:putative restriction endonuclease